jgi:hypothetical protein
MTINAHNKWTSEEEDRLRTLIESSMSMDRIAAKLERTVTAVKWRAFQLKISIRRASFGLKVEGK